MLFPKKAALRERFSFSRVVRRSALRLPFSALSASFFCLISSESLQCLKCQLSQPGTLRLGCNSHSLLVQRGGCALSHSPSPVFWGQRESSFSLMDLQTSLRSCSVSCSWLWSCSCPAQLPNEEGRLERLWYGFGVVKLLPPLICCCLCNSWVLERLRACSSASISATCETSAAMVWHKCDLLSFLCFLSRVSSDSAMNLARSELEAASSSCSMMRGRTSSFLSLARGCAMVLPAAGSLLIRVQDHRRSLSR